MPPACVYTFLLFWRDFFALDVTLVFIGVSVATFFNLAPLFFNLARTCSFGATFFNLARTCLFGATIFNLARLFLIWRDSFNLARLFLFGATFFAVAHFLIAGSNACVKQYLSNMAEIAVEVENDLEKASI